MTTTDRDDLALPAGRGDRARSLAFAGYRSRVVAALGVAGEIRSLALRRFLPALLLGAVVLAAGCDGSAESSGGPRVAALRSERLPYPAVPDLPGSAAARETSAEHFVLVDGDEIVRLGTRGSSTTTDVSVDELLRAFWRARRDPLGGRGAASPSAAPLLIARGAVPAERVAEVVAALWHHGARLAIGGAVPGAARQHAVLMFGEASNVERGAVVEVGPRGLQLMVPGEQARSFDSCGPSPSTACLARALDGAAAAGARTVLLRLARQAAGEPAGSERATKRR
jgi:hypothetical protein